MYMYPHMSSITTSVAAIDACTYIYILGDVSNGIDHRVQRSSIVYVYTAVYMHIVSLYMYMT
jgi:hypothetical protein